MYETWGVILLGAGRFMRCAAPRPGSSFGA